MAKSPTSPTHGDIVKHKKQEFTVTEWKMLLEAMRQLRLPSINQTVLKAKVAEHVGALQEEE